VLSRPLYPLGDLEDEPAEGGEANAQKTSDTSSASPFVLQDTCALSRSMASHKLLKSNRRQRGVR
jgi:hypothetical protein